MEPLWLVRAGTVAYRRAWAWQRALAERRVAGEVPDLVLLLEHPHVYTVGKRGSDADVLASPEWLAARGAEVVRTDRGGQVTYHGPGQLVGYPITRLHPEPDVLRFVGRVATALAEVAVGLGLDARTDTGLRTGVWVGDAKLAAIGMRVSRGVTSHGFALNCATDLAMFDAIVACGLPLARACSLSGLLGRAVTVEDVLPVVEERLAERLGRVPLPVDAATLDLPATDYWPDDLAGAPTTAAPEGATAETVHA
jgi:lipoyl(octanoyl) transferase